MLREFRLSPRGSGQGVSCDETGAFIGAIPLLERSGAHGKNRWQPRSSDELSKELGSHFGLPIDISPKTGRLKAIANALSEGDVARAQIATVLLGIPDLPTVSKSTRTLDTMIKFIRDLHWSGLIKWSDDEGALLKAGYNPDEPRDEHGQWTEVTLDGQGGQFAREESAAQTPTVAPATTSSESRLLQTVAVYARDVPGRRSEQECDEQYASDHAICDTLPTKRDKAICRASAAERYANCLRGKPMPPLALPENDYTAPQESPQPSPPSFPVRPPWWVPFLLLPLPAGIPV